MTLLTAAEYPKDDAIALRPPTPEDSPEMLAMVRESLSDLQPWMSWAADDYNEDGNLRWIASVRHGWEANDQFAFVITDLQTGTLLGGCGLNHVDTFYRLANLGYWVRSSRRGQGIAPRAARLVGRFAFERAGLLRAEIVVAVGNYASLRVAEKSGAYREGVLRSRILMHGRAYDAVMHSFIASDFGL